MLHKKGRTKQDPKPVHWSLPLKYAFCTIGTSVADLGRLFRIPESEFFNPNSGSCGGLHLVINIYFMLCVCLANYGASEAVYPCIVVEKIHESF
jgi:hypothetical protein